MLQIGGSGGILNSVFEEKQREIKGKMMSILPSKFDGSSDLATWLREFDACSLANDWKGEDNSRNCPRSFVDR